MKNFWKLIFLNRKKYVTSLIIMMIIGIIVNLLFGRHPFSLTGFFPIIIIFIFGLYKDFKKSV
jgi:hypothetical protein